MHTTQTAVLIVGGGAAGSMLTLQLARYGVAARTVDRLDKPATSSKAITIHARTAEIFEQIDPRLIGRYLQRGIHNKGYVLHFVNDSQQRSEVRPGIDFTTLDSKYPFIIVHGQGETEQVLRDYTKAEYGRSTEWGVECTQVQHEADGVLATLRHADGEQEQVHCRYLVACDGMNSRVRQSLGLVQDESDYAGAKMQNLDVFLNDFPDAEDYVHYCAGTDHFIMIVKLPGGFYRLLLSDRGEAALPGVSPEQAFMNLIDKHFDGVTLGEIVWHSKWESWARLAHTYRDKNVFLAGDSAHVHSTTGGQGMNCCMQDAYNLGWKLGLVLSGMARTQLLDSYEIERRPIAEQVIWAASSLHEIFMGHGKDIGERTKRIHDPEFIDAVVGRCSGLSYTYRDCVQQTTDTAALSGPVNGDRAPDVEIGNGKTLLHLLRHTGFTLLGIPGNRSSQGALASHLARIRARFGALLEVGVVPDCAEVTARYGTSSVGQLLLIRPDGYVAYRCTVDGCAALETYLEGEIAA
jgi:NADPH-dependent dioxygenase